MYILLYIVAPVSCSRVQCMACPEQTFLTLDLTLLLTCAQAKELGYTEPDPRDDLAGMDVARKVTILARCVHALCSTPCNLPSP